LDSFCVFNVTEGSGHVIVADDFKHDVEFCEVDWLRNVYSPFVIITVKPVCESDFLVFSQSAMYSKDWFVCVYYVTVINIGVLIVIIHTWILMLVIDFEKDKFFVVLIGWNYTCLFEGIYLRKWLFKYGGRLLPKFQTRKVILLKTTFENANVYV
jgi:hypothetical protein